MMSAHYATRGREIKNFMTAEKEPNKEVVGRTRDGKNLKPMQTLQPIRLRQRVKHAT